MKHGTADTHSRLPAAVAAALLCLAALGPTAARAGPPFFTDDPEPVDYKHGEFYVAGQFANSDAGSEGTAPHLELNYGPIPDVQLHVIFPMAFAHESGGGTNYGPGDLELGVKFRFVHETDSVPMVGTFPIVTLPTGSSDRGLGAGNANVFLPLWLQKSWGPWTTYGGGGYWINPGAGNTNYWQAGWLLQRQLVKALTVGTELFFTSKKEDAGSSRFAFKVGAIVNLTDDYHVLLSAGRDFSGDNLFSSYAAFQWTFGPHEEEKK